MRLPGHSSRRDENTPRNPAAAPQPGGLGGGSPPPKNKAGVWGEADPQGAPSLLHKHKPAAVYGEVLVHTNITWKRQKLRDRGPTWCTRDPGKRAQGLHGTPENSLVPKASDNGKTPTRFPHYLTDLSDPKFRYSLGSAVIGPHPQVGQEKGATKLSQQQTPTAKRVQRKSDP